MGEILSSHTIKGYLIIYNILMKYLNDKTQISLLKYLLVTLTNTIAPKHRIQLNKRYIPYIDKREG